MSRSNRAVRLRAVTPLPRRAVSLRKVDEAPLLSAVRAGLSAAQKTLPAALLYDDLGSALFEAITYLPEYEVTRADLRLLEAHAAEVGRRVPGADVAELGPGAGRKAKVFLERAAGGAERVFYAIDVSRQALVDCRRTVEQVPGVTVRAVEARYLEGLGEVVAARRPGVPLLVLFLGSNLSNFGRDEARTFLAEVRAQLQPHDAFLLATDLDKAPAKLVPAYDDAVGVTAAFNKNLLVRLNRELDADFDVSAFRHEARWSQAHRRIEMHLVATRPVTATVKAGGFSVHFDEGESLWTESSHRFTCDELAGWGRAAGFVVDAQWVDPAWAFAHSLFLVPKETT
ncbi:MAG: L-histidine N(alpha)-methyltransferase [Myxococcaceae bacterium]|jgi:dimethylhistidine N-methyltransferase|nr:L-histidine N(alpha)-methyltransferase [Myxococcaceae bacterium]